MNVQQTIKVFLTLLIFFGISESKAGDEIDNRSIALADFLTNLSEKHEVFFTYDPNSISGTTLNPTDYKYRKLNKIIKKLEKSTGFDFEYLGNKYYVVYDKTANQLDMASIGTTVPAKVQISASLLSLQQAVSGTVTDSDGSPLPGVNVIETGTSNGTTTDFDGNYQINVSDNASLTFSYVGFGNQTVSVNGRSTVDVSMQEGEELDEVVMVGSRAAARSSTDSPLPVDRIGVKELQNTGQITFDKSLQYRIPSFNTVQTPVNDATSLLDPYEIRNMGPSRTLILINGKRKNLSALLYTQTSPGRGETGADISAIPTDAIKEVQILRDGASAQYGSDAIAGVMNIILKDNRNDTSATVRTGITGEGDGEMFGIALNSGNTIGKDKGFINYTIDLSKVSLANRPGTVDATGEYIDFVFRDPNDPDNQVNGHDANSLIARNQAGLNLVNSFLDSNPDGGNINGSPETTAAKFLVNGGYDLSENSELYFNAAFVYKKVNSFANYRVPYWRQGEALSPFDVDGSDFFSYLPSFFPDGPNGSYVGYVPTFDGDLNDFNGTIGFKNEVNGWFTDVSFTTGGNRQTYRVRNSHNRNLVLSPSSWIDANGDGNVDPGELTQGSSLYRENSPISFDPGGTQFNHIVGNLDISKSLSDITTLSFGAEFRSETFEVIEGELASYDGGGADSFAGNQPENSGKFNRYNFGGYVDAAFDFTENFLVNATLRTENYSDFGNAFVWKISSRYKFADDKFTLRGSLSTGFRAPTLHQIFTQKAQFSFIPGQGIQVGGLINNVSPQARLLNIPQLDAEESTNFTVGLGAKISNNFNFTIDYYNIAVEDRIVLSNEIGRTTAGNTPLDDVLNANNLSDVSFFVNALDTKTSGIDVVANYRNIGLGNGTLGFSLAGNYTIQNERDGAVNNPQLVESAGQSVVDATQEALFFTSRPQTKWILGANYEIGKFDLLLNNTYFGKTTFKQQGLSNDLRTEFIPKIVTDLGVNWSATEKITVALNINNILDVLPEWSFKAENAAGQAIIDDTTTDSFGLTQLQNQSNLITFNQRYSQMTYDGYHFSQLGTMVNLSLNYRF